MNCYFCKTEGDDSDSLMCYNCPTKVWNTANSMGRVLLVYMYVDNYTIGLDIYDNYCFIINEKQEYLLKMNYIPQVNPNNVEQYVKKLLKLKAFL